MQNYKNQNNQSDSDSMSSSDIESSQKSEMPEEFKGEQKPESPALQRKRSRRESINTASMNLQNILLSEVDKSNQEMGLLNDSYY